MVAVTILVLLAACCSIVHGGQVDVKFAETDFTNNEVDGIMTATIVVTGTQEDGPIHFEVEAMTSQVFQSNTNNAQPETPFCQNIVNLPTDAQPADLSDLVEATVMCSRPLDATGTDVTCQFLLSGDSILEANEYLVLRLTVNDTAGNAVSLIRNCAIGRIISDLTNVNFLLLNVTTASLELTEGGAPVFIELGKEFVTDQPITITTQVTSQMAAPDSEEYGSPQETTDYLFNRVSTFPANATTLRIEFSAVDDSVPETREFLIVVFSARINSLNTDIQYANDRARILIRDNDAVTSGFNPTKTAQSFNVMEGTSSFVQVCAELIDPTTNIQKNVEIDINAVDGTALDGVDYRVTAVRPLDEFTRNLWFVQDICIDVQILDNNALQGPITFTIELTDRRISRFNQNDPELALYRALSIVNPSVVTVTIQDNDGTPLAPVIDEINFDGSGNLITKWSTDEQNGLRIVDCHNGMITELIKTQGNTTRGDTVTFDLCSGNAAIRKQRERTQIGLDPLKCYEVEVCAVNQLGTTCSSPAVYTYMPPPVPTAPPFVGLTPGAIAGIVVVILLLLFCCLLLLILLLLWYCCWEKEKRYFPQKRERMFAKEAHRHSAHMSVLSDEYETVIVPLD